MRILSVHITEHNPNDFTPKNIAASLREAARNVERHGLPFVNAYPRSIRRGDVVVGSIEVKQRVDTD